MKKEKPSRPYPFKCLKCGSEFWIDNKEWIGLAELSKVKHCPFCGRKPYLTAEIKGKRAVVKDYDD